MKVRILMCQPMCGDEREEHRRHATGVDIIIRFGRVAMQKPVLRLLHDIRPCHIVGAEVDAVALHEMLGLDGGKHRIHPAQRTAALILHGRSGEDDIIMKHQRPMPLTSMLARHHH